jgi:hypothetical protein
MFQTICVFSYCKKYILSKNQNTISSRYAHYFHLTWRVQIIRVPWAIRNIFTVAKTVKSIFLHSFSTPSKFQKTQFNKDRSDKKYFCNIGHTSKYKCPDFFHKMKCAWLGQLLDSVLCKCVQGKYGNDTVVYNFLHWKIVLKITKILRKSALALSGIFLGLKGGRSARKADNITAICETIV